jgi:hypothetical protein
MSNLGFKKWGFLLLGTLFLISSLLPGFAEQLNKLPFLVNHYRHHVEEHDTASFSEFITLHYGEDPTHRNEENHQDLPLYHVSGTVLIIMLQKFTSSIVEVPELAFVEFTAHKQQLYASLNPGTIFQPPRLG